MKKIATIIGTRPQFIKVAAVSNIFRGSFKEFLINTGQHYDFQMSRLFFKQLGIKKPDFNLGVGSGSQGQQTGKMIIELEKILMRLRPNLVLVYGDTNSTLAGALAAAKLNIPIAHIEAGMRCYDISMPEEINRIITDHVSTILFCSTVDAVKNLKNEGFKNNIFKVGDVMIDVLKNNYSKILKNKSILKQFQLKPFQYKLLTIHRASNTDNKENLLNILSSLSKSNKKIIFPIHPRTIMSIKKFNLLSVLRNHKTIVEIKPVGYLEMLTLQKFSNLIITDSGGIQKEAYFLKVPCLTLRENTEWTETVRDGWNILAGNSAKLILKYLNKFPTPKVHHDHYGNGQASYLIRKHIYEFIK